MGYGRSHVIAAGCFVLTLLVASFLGMVSPATTRAHGIWAHVHVTGWAVENLPDGELADFFEDPEVLNALWFGAAYTDSGYWVQEGPQRDAAHAYSEANHWPPFIRDAIALLLRDDPPPFDSLESRQRVAFFMGCAAHGLQDEIFDSLFLYQVQAHDGYDQEEADPGVDGFLALEGRLRFFPHEFLPTEALLELYGSLDVTVTEETLRTGVDLMETLYLNDALGVSIARGLGRHALETLPWTAEQYLDPEIPGSLRTEILPTAALLQAIWDRLHDRWSPDDLVIFTFPEAPRRLLGADAGSPDGWVSLVTSVGMVTTTLQTTWTDDLDQAVPYHQRGTRWSGGGFSRIVRLQPSIDLEPGGWYRVTLEPGLTLINEVPFDTAFELEFQAPCHPDDLDTCPDLGELPIPAIDPVIEPEPEPDTDLDGGDGLEADDLPQAPTPDGDRAPTGEGGCQVVVKGEALAVSPILVGLMVGIWVALSRRRRRPERSMKLRISTRDLHETGIAQGERRP